jgi:hypothetical protein
MLLLHPVVDVVPTNAITCLLVNVSVPSIYYLPLVDVVPPTLGLTCPNLAPNMGHLPYIGAFVPNMGGHLLVPHWGILVPLGTYSYTAALVPHWYTIVLLANTSILVRTTRHHSQHRPAEDYSIVNILLGATPSIVTSSS